MEAKKVTYKTVVTKFGVTVLKKCASCENYEATAYNKDVKSVGWCGLDDKPCKGCTKACESWVMREKLNHLGDAFGRVHTPEWVAYVTEHADALSNGGEDYRNAMIREFEAAHGSRFMNI